MGGAGGGCRNERVVFEFAGFLFGVWMVGR
jgi:hypothetical protein